MGIDAEGLLLESQDGSWKIWKICSWAFELPRYSLGLPKYSLLYHFLETEDDFHLPLFCLRSSELSRCDSVSPSYQMLKAMPGDVADVIGDQYDWATAEAHQESMFYAHGLNSYARSLLHFLKTSEVQVPVQDASFWERHNYGGLLVHALSLGAYGSVCRDLNRLFRRAGDELCFIREGETCETMTTTAVVGRIELHFDRCIDGQLWLFEDEKGEMVSFSGHKVLLDIGCRKLGRLVFDKSQAEKLVEWRIFAPPETSDSTDSSETLRCWFRGVLLCLRRRLPQVPTRRVVEFVRPCFPQRNVALGLCHDHINWLDIEWTYETPKFDLLMSCEEELIELVKQLQSYGCPFQLPFWLQLNSPSWPS